MHEPGSSTPAPIGDAAVPGPSPRVPVLELPFVMAPGPGPRLVAAGAALAAFAFVLPWVPGGAVVLGAAFGSGYFSTWGLAAIANLLPFLVALVGLALAVLPNRVPRLAALGVLPAVLGGVLAGIAWTYLIAGSGAGIGIWALAGGAILLAAWRVARARGGSLGRLARVDARDDRAHARRRAGAPRNGCYTAPQRGGRASLPPCETPPRG